MRSRESDAAVAYRRAADAEPALSREHELELGQRARSGDRFAIDRLARAHLRSVLRIASSFKGYGVPEADLIGEGNIGLVEAMRRFEPDRGLRFYTYARYWIRARMLAYVLRHSAVAARGTGTRASRLFFGLQAEKARLEAELGPYADHVPALAELFGVGQDRVREELHRLRSRDVSLDERVGPDADAPTRLDALASPDPDPRTMVSEREQLWRLRSAASRVWRALDSRERAILEERLYTDEPASLAAIGERFGVTRERIRQIESGVKTKLRGALDAEGAAPLRAA